MGSIVDKVDSKTFKCTQCQFQIAQCFICSRNSYIKGQEGNTIDLNQYGIKLKDYTNSESNNNMNRTTDVKTSNNFSNGVSSNEYGLAREDSQKIHSRDKNSNDVDSQKQKKSSEEDATQQQKRSSDGDVVQIGKG